MPTDIPSDPPSPPLTGYYFGSRVELCRKCDHFFVRYCNVWVPPCYRGCTADRQVKEAEDYLKQANKCLQKTITRWNPNYFSAAPLFEKVGCRVIPDATPHGNTV